jgi:arylsulfatase A-like enzyme
LELTDRTIIVFFSDNGGVHWLDDRMRERFGLTSPPTSNAPLRGGKATLYEGGTRVPCVVAWPGHVKAGTVTDSLLCSVDFYPTLLEMVRLAPPDAATLDGLSQVPALTGAGRPREIVFCFFPHYTPATGNIPGVWVRKGDWKLIRFFHDSPDQSDRYELYNLENDIGESTNLAEEIPVKVTELNGLIDEHLRETRALRPKPNPAYDGRRQGHQ